MRGIGFARAFALSLGLIAVGAGSAWGQVQTSDQQKCINKVNVAGFKLAKAQGGDNKACVKDGGNDGLGVLTGEQCLTADRKGKVSAREAKVTGFESKYACTGAAAPDFGYTSAANINAVADQAEIDMMHDLFGNPVTFFPCDPNENECVCQRLMINRIEKLMAVMPRLFGKCKKAALKLNDTPFPNGASSAAELQTCLDDAGTPESLKAALTLEQVMEAEQVLRDTLDDRCEASGVTTVSFPGPACAGLAGQPMADCIILVLRCRVCLMINQMDSLAADCDLFDDNTANATCPP